MNLNIFNSDNLFKSTTKLFEDLGIKLNSNTEQAFDAKSILKEYYKERGPFSNIKNVYFTGLIDDSIFEKNRNTGYTFDAAQEKNNEEYPGIMLFSLELNEQPNRTEISDITRAFNKVSKGMPVVLILKYGTTISLTISERTKYLQEWRQGDKVGKVIILKDIDTQNPHAAHLKILFGDNNRKSGLRIYQQNVTTFSELWKYWQAQFSIQTLNEQFYEELQKWFDFASHNITLPYKQPYQSEKENVKNFLVRLLSRMIFCWFIKEKGLIQSELLELYDYKGIKYKLTNDAGNKDFLQKNSYYRGILQNIFFHSLNQKEKKNQKDFKWIKYLTDDFNYSWFTSIPYLNGGIFDKLDEDNAKESIEDTVIKIPNFLFYGNDEHKGLNQILKSFKFTLEENTPYEEDIALDPEMLGLVFENLLAELDPNLEESTIKSIRKQTGSYYTPRKVIREMVNDTLFIYLKKHVAQNQESMLYQLIYNDITIDNNDFSERLVAAIDKFKMLDPACGSGAFPMGMLHRLVEILKKVDATNEKWLRLKLEPVDPNYRAQFEKTLKQHLDDYSRKLGIIRDSIYGIDIQPLAAQITKLRFFISLLVDQKTDTGITPMPNIETKIICADSLKNVNPDLFSVDAVTKLTEARRKYYQPDLSQEDKDKVADDIAKILSVAFPSFAKQVTGKTIDGQNELLIKDWFMHGTLAAPFFNMDFFYPELKEHGGFDCVMGNPPYGGTKIGDDVREALAIESKDPYGAFIARFLSSPDRATPLKEGGVLAYIVSDTFMTIKSHLKLRKQMMSNYIHKMIRVHPDTFRATVNTAIIICERNGKREFDANHICQMADMTNISIHENYSRFTEILRQTEGVAFGAEKQSISNAEYAIYYYPQQLIRSNSNLPFFVASPKLFALINDENPRYSINKGVKIFYTINNLTLYRIGDDYSGSGRNKKWDGSGLFKIVSGIKTGNNQKYLRILDENAQKDFGTIDICYLLNEDEIKKLSSEEKLDGIDNKKSWVRFEMGQPSDLNNGFLPCYYQPESSIVINWSKISVRKMKEEKHSDLANSEFRFLPINRQISFSFAGQYAPTFRMASAPIFLNAASRIFFSDKESLVGWLGFLNSKLFRFFSKTFINHTVNFGVDDIKKILVLPKHNFLNEHVLTILKKQNSNPLYDYASHEQIEIDKLVYEAYGLSPNDIEEVENWYARRYPKLSEAQKQNLRRLGKSDDYLVLYGYKKAEQ